MKQCVRVTVCMYVCIYYMYSLKLHSCIYIYGVWAYIRFSYAKWVRGYYAISILHLSDDSNNIRRYAYYKSTQSLLFRWFRSSTVTAVSQWDEYISYIYICAKVNLLIWLLSIEASILWFRKWIYIKLNTPLIKIWIFFFSIYWLGLVIIWGIQSFIAAQSTEIVKAYYENSDSPVTEE